MNRPAHKLLFVFALTLIGAGIAFMMGLGGLTQGIATFSWLVLILAVISSVLDYKKENQKARAHKKGGSA